MPTDSTDVQLYQIERNEFSYNFNNMIVEVLILFATAFLIALSLYFRGYHFGIDEDDNEGGDDNSTIRYIHHQPINQTMVASHNPFVLRMDNASACSLQNAELVLTCTVECIVQDFWGVNIEKLYKLIHFDWHEMVNAMNNNNLLNNSCRYFGSKKIFPPCVDKPLNFHCPIELDASDFGQNPRLEFPLVIVILLHDILSPSAMYSVVGLFTSVHLKDNIVTMDSEILNQYLKFSNNTFTLLQKLYAPSEEDSCVICCTNRICIVLLPCRHVCICQECYPRLDKCPICRSRIYRIFDFVNGFE